MVKKFLEGIPLEYLMLLIAPWWLPQIFVELGRAKFKGLFNNR